MFTVNLPSRVSLHGLQSEVELKSVKSKIQLLAKKGNLTQHNKECTGM